MKTRALLAVLSRKVHDNELLLLDNLVLAKPKTKDAREILSVLSGVKGFEMLLKKRNNSVLIALSEADLEVYRSFKNFGNVSVVEARNLNTLDILTYKYLIIVNPKSVIEMIGKKLSTKTNKS